MPDAKRGYTLLELLVVIFVLAVLAALVVPPIARAQRNARVTRCVSNLAQLWKMEHNYTIQHGCGGRIFPLETGGEFWLRLSRIRPPLIDETLHGIYRCPVRGDEGAPGTTDFRGPRTNVNLYGDGDPTGADKVGNHGAGAGGNVARKSGDVLTVPENDPLWSVADTKTVP